MTPVTPITPEEETNAAIREALAATHDIRNTFGAPGDYGYGTKQGDALLRLFDSTQGLADIIAAKKGSRSFNCEGTLMVLTLFKRWLVVIGRLETKQHEEIRAARSHNILKVSL